MAALGLSVPPAFILPVELCAAITKGEPGARKTMVEGLDAGLKFLERATGRIFGDPRRPLLVSVRSGAAALDARHVGYCARCWLRARRRFAGLIRMTGNPHFAYDCRRRFLESYGGVVLGIEAAVFAAPLASLAAAEGETQEQDLDSEALERLAAAYQQIVEDHGSCADDPRDDLKAAAEAVYMSWMSERACAYRRIEHLEDLRGTAVTGSSHGFWQL